MSAHQRDWLQQYLRLLGQGSQLLRPHHLKDSWEYPRWCHVSSCSTGSRIKKMSSTCFWYSSSSSSFWTMNPARSSSISCPSRSLSCSTVLHLASIVSPSSLSQWVSTLVVSLAFSVFLNNLTPSSTSFRAIASSLSATFSLERRSSLSSMWWSMYTFIVSTTSNHLKSKASCYIRLQTQATT